MKTALFPGCLVAYRYPEYEKSASLILDLLETPLGFVPEFTCCGSQVLESVDETAQLALGARNLAIAQSYGVEKLVTLCGSCTFELLRVRERMDDPRIYESINALLKAEGLEYRWNKSFKVMHIVEFLSDPLTVTVLKNSKTREVRSLVALQEPCNASRPERLHPEMEPDAFNRIFRSIIEISGAEVVDYDYERRCCGGTMMAFDEEVGKGLAALRYEALRKSRAGCVVSACPNCQAVYDLYPFLVDKKYRKKESRLPPGIFFTQLLGLSLGFGFEELGFGGHRDRKRLEQILVC